MAVVPSRNSWLNFHPPLRLGPWHTLALTLNPAGIETGITHWNHAPPPPWLESSFAMPPPPPPHLPHPPRRRWNPTGITNAEPSFACHRAQPASTPLPSPIFKTDIRWHTRTRAHTRAHGWNRDWNHALPPPRLESSFAMPPPRWNRFESPTRSCRCRVRFAVCALNRATAAGTRLESPRQ